MDFKEHVAPRDVLKLNVLFRRAQLRLSQSALAKQAATSRLVISEIENGRFNATLEVLERIAAALETSVVDLLTHHVVSGSLDADIDRRVSDCEETYVDANAFLKALDDQTAGQPERYSNRGREAAV